MMLVVSLRVEFLGPRLYLSSGSQAMDIMGLDGSGDLVFMVFNGFSFRSIPHISGK